MDDVCREVLGALACGFFTTAAGKVWAAQNFLR
jgi:hypothetical protein